MKKTHERVCHKHVVVKKPCLSRVFKFLKNTFSSISFWIMFMIITSSIFSFSMAIFWTVKSCVHSIQEDALRRTHNFHQFTTDLSFGFKTVENSIIALEGDRRYLCEMIFGDSNESITEKIIWTFLHVKSLDDILRLSNQFVFGVWAFEQNLEDERNLTGFSMMNGKYFSFWPSGENQFNIVSFSVTKNNTEEILVKPNNSKVFDVTDEIVERFSSKTPSSSWDYWIFEEKNNQNLTDEYKKVPYFSFRTISNTTVVKNGVEKNITIVIRFAISIDTINQFMQKYSSEESVSWLFDLTNKYLLGVSFEEDLFVDDKFYNPVEYTGDEIVRKMTTKIYNNEDFLNKLKNSPSFYHERDFYGTNQLEMFYFSSRYFGGEWMFVDATTLWILYGNQFLWFFLMCFVYIIAIIIFICLWVLLVIFLARSFWKLLKEVKKIEDMNLSEINLKTKTFTELKYVRKIFENIIRKIKRFRPFLPQSILHGMEDSTLSLDDSSKGSLEEEMYLETLTDSSENNLRKFGSQFELGLEEKVMTILTIFFKVKQQDDLQSFYQKIFMNFQKHIIYYFDEKHIIIIFSKSFFVSTMNTISKITKKKWDKLEYLKFVLIKEVCLCGNLGTENAKRFICKGKALDLANRFFTVITEKIKVNFVANEKIGKICSKIFEARVIEILDEGELIFEIGNPFEIENYNEGSWLNELQDNERNDRWKNYKDSINHFKNGDYKKSYQKMKDYLDEYQQDEIALMWLVRILKQSMFSKNNNKPLEKTIEYRLKKNNNYK